jgi:hypothetical protein
MLCAAPLVALGCGIAVPAYGAMGVDLPQDPIQLAFLFLITLLGTWGVLVPTKLWEGRSVSWPSRRLQQAAIGLALGALGVGLAQWIRLFPSPVQQVDVPREVVSMTGAALRPDLGLAAFAGYFALVFGLNGWWKLTGRDRPSRFRFWPVMKAGAVAGLLGLAWPSPQPWAVIPVVLIAVVSQVVSPWSREAAAAALAACRYRKRAVA